MPGRSHSNPAPPPLVTLFTSSIAGRGFITVSIDWQKSLGRGILLPNGRQAYAVSMFHQLHCLVCNSPSSEKTYREEAYRLMIS